MIGDLETGLANYLTARITSGALLTAGTWVVVPATAVTEFSAEKANIVVRVADLPRTAGSIETGGLYDAAVEITVQVAADLTGAVTLQRTAERAVLAAWVGATLSGLKTTVQAQLATGQTVGGYYARGWRPGREETNFLPVFEVTVGVDTTA